MKTLLVILPLNQLKGILLYSIHEKYYFCPFSRISFTVPLQHKIKQTKHKDRGRGGGLTTMYTTTIWNMKFT